MPKTGDMFGFFMQVFRETGVVFKKITIRNSFARLWVSDFKGFIETSVEVQSNVRCLSYASQKKFYAHSNQNENFAAPLQMILRQL